MAWNDRSQPRPPGSGECDRLITIESITETQNSSGEMVPGSTVVLGPVWAKKVALGGNEGVAARQIQATAAYRWELRHYVNGVTAKMWVNERGVLFDINEVQEIGRRAGLHLGTTQRGV